MIKTIIFDLGGVVLTNDFDLNNEEFFNKFSRCFSLTKEDMQDGWKTVHHRFFEGKINEEEFWGVLLKTKNMEDIEKAKKIWRKHQRPLENMFDLLKKLKRKYRLAALTNVSKEWLSFKIKKFRLDDYFDLIVSSCYVGIAKSEKSIYKIFVEKLSETPKECLFIDDKERNLAPARELGMETLLFKGQRDLEAKLKGMGIEF